MSHLVTAEISGSPEQQVMKSTMKKEKHGFIFKSHEYFLFEHDRLVIECIKLKEKLGWCLRKIKRKKERKKER